MNLKNYWLVSEELKNGLERVLGGTWGEDQNNFKNSNSG
jgi:hypothetical protein